MTNFYYSVEPPLILLTPLAIMIAAILVAIRVRRYKWVVHALALAAVLPVPAFYVWLDGILDPTLIDFPALGQQFVTPAYLEMLVPMFVIYCFVVPAVPGAWSAPKEVIRA